MSLDDTPSIFDSQSSLLSSVPGDASQDADIEQIPSESATDTGRGGAPINSDVNDANEEPEEKDEVQGLGFPTARVQRIMRKHPDKKKRFVKEAVHAVAISTVLSIFCLESFRILMVCCLQDLFLQNFCKCVYEVTVEKKRKTIALSDVSELPPSS